MTTYSGMLYVLNHFGNFSNFCIIFDSIQSRLIIAPRHWFSLN